MRTMLIPFLVALAMPAVASAAPEAAPRAGPVSGTVEIRFTGGQRGGPVLVQLSSETEFMRPSRFQSRVDVRPDGTARVSFEDVPPGRYAISAFQDVNRDGRLTFGPPWGAPVEPWGYSRGARGVMGPPNFDDAAVRIGPEGAVISVALGL